ncbi:hypothetical protein K4F52_007392 [Lecanicillium sp. MT-2017a]|nr:hypothetical protein K4F52_007392 [Lecanicillium sp. MT-2017a]
MRRQLLELQATNRRDEGRRRLTHDAREDVEMRRVKHELSLRQESRSRADLNLKLKEEFEKKRLEKEIKEKKETQRREKEAKEAVEQYKLQEADKVLKDKNANEEFEKQYKVWLEQRLTLSGLDEKHIKAIMNKEKIPGDSPSRAPERYTRMLRKHVSLETLRTFAINFEYDGSEDETIIVKRHVPEWEIKELDAHTRFVRERRERVPSKGKGHYKGGREIMTGKRKHSKRKHGKDNLPLLMYLAGYRP